MRTNVFKLICAIGIVNMMFQSNIQAQNLQYQYDELYKQHVFLMAEQLLMAEQPNQEQVRKKNNLQTPVVLEKEQDNDNIVTAQFIPNISSVAGENNRVLIKGDFGEKLSLTSVDKEDDPEDNDAIPLVTPQTLNLFETTTFSGTIGDGAHGTTGTGTGDVDFKAFEMQKDQIITIDVKSEITFLAVRVYDSEGEVLARDYARSGDLLISFIAPKDGVFYFSFAYFFTTAAPSFEFDPFVSGSGNEAGPEGPYEVTFSNLGSRTETDTDAYSLVLRKGDLISASILGAKGKSTIDLFMPDGTFTASASNDMNLVTALGSREEIVFPTSGQTSITYIIPEDGLYFLTFTDNFEAYEVELLVTRPFLEVKKGVKQYVYIDFVGENTEEVAPFEDFIERWGVENNPINRLTLTSGIVQEIKEDLYVGAAINPNFGVRVISNYGNKFLAKQIPVLLEEAGIEYSTVLIAGSSDRTLGRGSFDPFNTYLNDRTQIFLNSISSDDPDVKSSLNNIPLADGTSKEDLIIRGVGHLSGFLAGSLFGAFIVDSEDVMSLMNGNFRPKNIGVNDEGVFDITTAPNRTFVASSTPQDDFFYSKNTILRNNLHIAYGLSYFPDEEVRAGVENQLDRQLTALENSELSKLQTQQAVSNLRIYPNPQQTNGVVTVSFTSNKRGFTTVNLYSVQGRNLGSLFEGVLEQGEQKTLTLPLQGLNLSSGTYFYQIHTGGTTDTKRLVIK